MSNSVEIQKLAVDILRANKAKVFVTKCIACGKSQTQSLHWLQSKRFTCPACGGRLDDSPLHQLTLSVLRKLRARDRKTERTVIKKALSTCAPKQGKTFQLILQFRGDTLEDLEAVVVLEDELNKLLDETADVDGHDIGSGETNIFIFTCDPITTFRQLKPFLERTHRLQAVTAAYRQIEDERYIVIWPERLRRKFTVV